MTAPFSTEEVQPRLNVTYQMLSLIPARHELLRQCDTYGEWNPAEDLVSVPDWLYYQIEALVGGNEQRPQPEPVPHVNTPQEQPTITYHTIDTNTVPYHTIDTGRIPYTEPEQVFWLEIQDCVQVHGNPATEQELLSSVLEQFHNIQEELNDRVTALLEWAHEQWRSHYAVRVEGQTRDAEQENQPTESRDRDNVGIGGTELPNDDIRYRILADARANLRNNE